MGMSTNSSTVAVARLCLLPQIWLNCFYALEVGLVTDLKDFLLFYLRLPVVPQFNFAFYFSPFFFFKF